jgi:hypothetical protein
MQRTAQPSKNDYIVTSFSQLANDALLGTV